MDEEVFVFGSFRLIPAERTLFEDGKPVRLGSRALDILAALTERAGEIISKEELIARTWPGTVVEEAALRVHVAALRKALGDGRAGKRYIANLSGRGYAFIAPVTRENGALAPAAPTGVAEAGNLPALLVRVVGRDDVISKLAQQLVRRRFLTIVGSGGIGKTTVAVAVADVVRASYGDGAWYVELASLSDPDLVPSTLCALLGITLLGVNPLSALTAWLRDKHILIVLDNCEHVIGASAALAEAILKAAPHAGILATAREPLRAEGEWLHRLAPLELPPEGSVSTTAIEALGYSAVELFNERATARMDRFVLDDADVPAVFEICRRLDGVPLALELAAARVDTIGVDGLAVGLGDRFRLLTRGRRTALPRHQSLRAALDWSYELLPPDEQRLLRHLAIFPGGFTFEAAEAVGALEGAGDVIVDGISSLVAKSLLTADEGATAPRWRLLETIRAYASQKLVESGEHIATARRHAEYFRRLIVPSTTEPVRRLTVDDVLRYGRELDNVRAALDWSFSSDGDAAIGVALAAAFAPVWVHMSLVVECRTRAEQVLELLRSDLQLTQALEHRLLMALGVALTLTLGPIEQTREVIAKARRLGVGIDDAEVQLRMLWTQWLMESNMGEYGAALGTAHQFASLARRQGNEALALLGDRFLGTSMLRVGELNEARSLLERMVNRYVAPQSGRHTISFNFDLRVMARANLARALSLQGYLDQAKEQVRLSLEEARDADKVTFCWVLYNGAFPVALMTGDLAAAEEAAATMNDLATRLDAALWKIVGSCWKGTLLIARREFAQGSALLRDALDLCERSGWRMSNPEFLGDFARGLAGLERFDEAIAIVDRALVRAESSRGLSFKVELSRIKGEVFLQQGPDDEALAEDCFRAAGELARTQGALFWELRAALSLARLLRGQGCSADAISVLQPVYDRFTEGFDTADLKAAKALLDALH
jgi:predicted ATPase/DNA-binding winged helix-turn-helix (wHTH) protein